MLELGISSGGGTYFRAVYGLNGLIVTNVVFAIIDVVAVIACATYSTLQAYFDSLGFEILTFIEGVRNVVYSVFLAYYGVKLVRRFWHFSKIERQSLRVQKQTCFQLWISSFSDSTDNGTREAVFTKVLLRLTTVLILSTVCFMVRVCMLLAKMVALHSDSYLTSPSFTLFGILWFIVSDFIPRVLPCLAFILLMKTKRQPTKDMNAVPSSRKNSLSAFQFISLIGEDEEEEGDFSELADGGSNDKTERMLNASHFLGDSDSNDEAAASVNEELGERPEVYVSSSTHRVATPKATPRRAPPNTPATAKSQSQTQLKADEVQIREKNGTLNPLQKGANRAGYSNLSLGNEDNSDSSDDPEDIESRAINGIMSVLTFGGKSSGGKSGGRHGYSMAATSTPTNEESDEKIKASNNPRYKDSLSNAKSPMRVGSGLFPRTPERTGADRSSPNRNPMGENDLEVNL